MNNFIQSLIENKQIFGYIQPKYSIRHHRIVGGEVLFRAQDKDGLLTYPTLAPHLDPDSLLLIDKTIFIQTLSLIDLLIEKKILIKFSFNIPPLFALEYIDFVLDTVSNHSNSSMLPYYILFECNESQLINNNLINQFFKLFSKGYYISIDDFGCQQSNFKQLLLLEEFITEIKADMYFTQHYERPLNKIILEFLIKFSFVLQSSTCAEGVETKEQLDALSTLGYHYFQGFYFYPPMSPTDFLNLLLTSNNILLHIDKNANNEIIMWSNLDDTNLFDG